MLISRPKLLNLQVLRFFAAFLVAAGHVAGTYRALAGGEPGYLDYIGFAGVDIFYVLSGFIMWKTTSRLSGPGRAGNFTLRRYWRIYTAYLPIAGFMLAITFLMNGLPAVEKLEVVRSLLLLPTAPPDRLLGVSWTLTHELLFYSVMAASILFSKARVLILIVFTLAIMVGVAAQIEIPTQTYWVKFLFNPMIFEFIFGILVAVCHERRPAQNPIAILITGVALFSAVGLAYWHFTFVPGEHVSALVRVGSYGIASAVIIYGAANLDARFTPPAFLVKLGDASYALYLVHIPVILLVWHVPQRFGVTFFLDHMNASVGLILCLAVLTSLAYFRFVEMPLLGFVRTSRKSVAAMA
ncbi:MAG: acyltransferase [Mesorhizobium sp.]|nr:MAG: acyltransferase [Mesorhizobium sp.]